MPPVNRPAQNPFVSGRLARAKAFVDRSKDLADLVRDLADHKKVFLLSRRRYGKTSLIAEAFERFEA